VLLRNGNKYPSVPLAHAVYMKESFENMKLLLEKIHYEKYKCNICGDLKVLGLWLGYTKYCCFLCEWDSKDRKTIASKNNGQNEIHLFQKRKMC
jgi:hypothetical protein